MSKSVADALTDIAASLGTLLTQINAKLSLKGVSEGADTMAKVPDKINAIVTGSGIDTSDADATAADILKPKTAYVDGSKLTGTLEITSRSASDVTVSGRTVTVPAGNYSSQVQKSVAAATQATPSISVNTSTGVVTATASQSAGYVSSGSKSATYSLPTQAAQTITPGRTDQTISSGKYLTGTQTIKGDTNLTASNIKKGVSIFGVPGSFEAGGDIQISNNVNASRTSPSIMVFSGLSAPSGKTLVGVVVGQYSYDESPNTLAWAVVFKTASGSDAVYCDHGSRGVILHDTNIFTLSFPNNSVGTIEVNTSYVSFDTMSYKVYGIYA